VSGKRSDERWKPSSRADDEEDEISQEYAEEQPVGQLLVAEGAFQV